MPETTVTTTQPVRLTVSLLRGPLAEAVDLVDVRETDDGVAVSFGDGTDWVELTGQLDDVIALIVEADNQLARRKNR